MRKQSCRNFLIGVAALAISVVFAGYALAANHHELNGTWQLVPERSEFRGEPALQTGSVTIADREGNVYVSRNFNFDGPNGSTATAFETDARKGSSIKAPGFKNKTEWKGDILQVVTTEGGATTTERYSLGADGIMMLMVDRPGHASEMLLFQRQ